MTLYKYETKKFDGKTFYQYGGKHNTQADAKKAAEWAKRGADIDGRPHFVRIFHEKTGSYKYGSHLRFRYWYVYARPKPSTEKRVPLSELNKRYGF